MVNYYVNLFDIQHLLQEYILYSRIITINIIVFNELFIKFIDVFLSNLKPFTGSF